MEKKFDSINVASNLRRCFERASIISDIFDDEIIRSAYVMMSMFCENETSLNKFFEENGYKIIPEAVVSSILNYKVIFSDVFGEKAAEKFFNQAEQLEEISKTENEVNSENNNNESSDKESDENSEGNIQKDSQEQVELTDEQKFKAKILDALGEMITFETYEIDDDYNLDIVYSDKLLKVCEDASIRCIAGKQNFLDLDNLLYSLLNSEDTSAYKVINILLNEYKLEVSDVLDYLEQNSNIYIFSNSSIILPRALENCCTILNDKLLLFRLGN